MMRPRKAGDADALIATFATMNVEQLSLELGKAMQGLRDGSINPAQARRINRAADATLRAARDELHRAKQHSEKPVIPFFETARKGKQ